MNRMTQGGEFRNEEAEWLMGQLSELKEYVGASVRDAVAVHEVERGIWGRVLRLGREALGLYFSLQGEGDVGESVTLAKGRKVRRLVGTYARQYRSIFGEFTLNRVVYGTREGQKLEGVPLDARLQLPQSIFSYVLQDWDQQLAVENPYGQVNRVLSKILGFEQPLDSIERIAIGAAEAVPGYRETKPVPKVEEEGEYLVISADGKGYRSAGRRGACAWGQCLLAGAQARSEAHGDRGQRLYGGRRPTQCRRGGGVAVSAARGEAARTTPSPCEAIA